MKKRRCLYCNTPLSNYNPGPYCFAHTPGMPIKERFPVSKLVERQIAPFYIKEESDNDVFVKSDPTPEDFTKMVTGYVGEDHKIYPLLLGEDED